MYDTAQPPSGVDNLYQALFDLTSDGVCFLDAELAIVATNAAASREIGVPASYLAGKPAERFFEPTNGRAADLSTLVTQGGGTATLKLCRADGSTVLLSHRVVVDVAPGRHMTVFREVTPQQQPSEARFQKAMSAGRMGTWEWDLESGVISWSSQLEELHGMKEGEFDGTLECVLAHVLPTDRASMAAAADSLIEAGSHYAEYRIVRPDGDERWLSWRGHALGDAATAPTWATGVVVDITEDKRQQEALSFIVGASRILSSSLDYDTTLKAVADLAVSGMADWCTIHVENEEGEIELVALSHINPQKVAWARALQLSLPPAANAERGVAAVIRTGESLFLPEMPAEVPETLDRERRRALRELGLTSVMMVPMIARGRTFGTLTLVSAESGRHYTEEDLVVAEHLARRGGVAIENARVHRAVEHERARFASIVQSVDYGVCLVDRAGVIEYINPAASQLLQTTAADAMGSAIHPLIHSTDCVAEDCEVLAVLTTGEVFQGRTPLSARDKTTNLGISVSPVVTSHRVEGAVLSLRDVTQQLEQEQAKDDFLAFASHELRSPLAPVVGLARWLARKAEAVAETQFDEDDRGAIETILAESERMTRIVDLFLDISRLDAGQFRLDPEPVDLAATIREEVGEFVLRSADAEVILEIAPEPIPAITDAPRLRQVLSNLLENAVKYAGEAPRVTVSAEVADGKLVLAVADNGQGIRAEDQPHIFERFYRGDGTGERRSKGLGVGLYITKQIVTHAEGELDVESEPGRGTRITVRWPLRPSHY